MFINKQLRNQNIQHHPEHLQAIAMQTEELQTPLTIGYYPFRAKAQVIRLTCEYLHLPYRDRFFNPDQRAEDKQRKRWSHVSTEFPFLEHEGFVLSGNYAMLTYVIELSGKTDLLGKTLDHKAKIDLFKMKGSLEDIIYGFINSSRQTNDHEESQKRNTLKQFYRKKIQGLMQSHEQQCQPDNFYFGYLTVLDFSIYEIINYFKRLFPRQLARFPKLTAIASKISKIPEINIYEHSQRKIQEYCPIRYFQKFKILKLRALREINNHISYETTASQIKSE